MTAPIPKCCKYVDGETLMPGWGCGVCKTYNGLQRETCKYCGHVRCSLLIPEHVKRCSNCGFGWTGDPDWSHALDGTDHSGKCPCCHLPLSTMFGVRSVKVRA